MSRADGAGARRVPVIALAVGVLVLVACAAFSLSVGQRNVPLGQVVDAFLDYQPLDPDHDTVRTVRVSRTLLAVLVGAALAVAGALVQTLTRNPLAEPGLLGVTFGASFAVVLVTWLAGDGSQARQLVVAALGAGVASAMVYVVGRGEPLRLVLAGMALSSVLSGFSLAIRILDSEAFENYRFWAVGSLSGRDQEPLALPSLAIVGALVAALALLRPLGAIELGDDVAHGLGVPVGRARAATLVVATVLAGVATAVVGPIAFAGLIVPHVARRFAAGSTAWLVVLCLVLGPALLVGADVVARLLLPTGDVPVAIVTAVLGAPVLIWVVRRNGAALAR